MISDFMARASLLQKEMMTLDKEYSCAEQMAHNLLEHENTNGLVIYTPVLSVVEETPSKAAFWFIVGSATAPTITDGMGMNDS
jgi:hypothetical protein